MYKITFSDSAFRPFIVAAWSPSLVFAHSVVRRLLHDDPGLMCRIEYVDTDAELAKILSRPGWLDRWPWRKVLNLLSYEN